MSPSMLRLAPVALGWLVLTACTGEGGAEDALETVDLGTHTVAADGTVTPDIPLDLTADTTSALAWCGGYGDDSIGTVWTLSDAGGSSVWDFDAGTADGWRAEVLDDTSIGLVPVSPDLPAAEGTWTFTWYTEGYDGSVECGAVLRTGLGPDVGGSATVNAELVFVGGEITAATAPDDVELQSALDTLREEWDSAGLTLEISYADFGGDAGRFAVVDVTEDDYSEFNDLLRTADPADERSLTFFMVEEISSEGATILGLAGGPPGAAGVSRTSKSGIIVSTLDLRAAPDDVGKIMSHEGGHFLGLFHTTEKDGSNTDPLGDTPVCTDDANGNGTLNSDECAGAGAENVMWWTLTGPGASLSSDQGWVVRRNPVAY